MSLETAQKVIVPQKKNYVPHFLKQRDINSYFLLTDENYKRCLRLHLAGWDGMLNPSLFVVSFSLPLTPDKLQSRK
jgi:hypothetical protein